MNNTQQTQRRPKPRPVVALAAVLIASSLATACSHAAVISRPGHNQARIVHRTPFNDQVMHCTAENPQQPVCKVMKEQP